MNVARLPVLFAISSLIVAVAIAVLYLHNGSSNHPRQPLPTPTQDAFINLSRLKESTKEIKVILVNPFSSRVIALKKEDFDGEEDFGKKNDCTFVARQSAEIDKIYEILRRAGMHAGAANGTLYEPNEVIFIRLKNGALKKFFFERDFANIEWLAGDYNNSSISASPRLVVDLYEWAVAANPNLPCVEYLNAALRL